MIVVRATQIYRVRIALRHERGGTIAALEAETPARSFLSRQTLLDRAGTWEKLLAALGDAGFRSLA